ncbi:MAG: hypothetical protein RLZZ65_1045 [Bacteroidota bacterium]|jgi:hypothetical protein
MRIPLFTLLFGLVLVPFNTFSQSFFNRDTIQVIEIFFSFSNWDAQLDANAAAETYIYADSVRINGHSYDSCGVRYKGNSSFNANNQKNPLHIELNSIKGNQDYQGITDIKLSNCYKDPSMIREILSYQILENYMDCPGSNFARVYINGVYRGVYTNNQSIDDNFNSEHYYQANDTYFKCNPVGGAGPGSTVSPDLKYLGTDSSAYFNGYELQSTYGWNRMVNLCDALNNNFSTIENTLDIDRAIWMLAFNNVLVNLDSYSGAFRQNYYISWDNNGRFVPTVWDLNMSFGGFPGGTGGGSFTPSTLDPFSNSTSTNHPLIKQVMANPLYKRMYMAHVRTMVQEMFASGQYETWANNLMTLADSSIQADPFKFYTYSQYLNSLTTAVAGGGPGGGGSIPGIKALMDARAQFFSTNAAYLLQAPSINSHGTPSTPNYGSTITINASASNETALYLGYRTSHTLKFNRVQMFDDGLHNDGAANDHTYGYDVNLNGLTFEYFIYADNNNAGLFSPARAEHEFHTLAVLFPAPTMGAVLINEILAVNGSTNLDPNGQAEDWIELVNTTNAPIDLAGLYLSDDPMNITKWQIPAGTVIPANGYVLVWADKDTLESGLHTNFKLSANGEDLLLSSPMNVYDQVTFGVQTIDVSYARCPDAGLDFALVTPTPLANNNCSVGINEETIQVQVYPNPVQDKLVVVNLDANVVIQVLDLNGRSIYANTYAAGKHQIETSSWMNGLYIVQIQDAKGTLTYKIVKQ